MQGICSFRVFGSDTRENFPRFVLGMRKNNSVLAAQLVLVVYFNKLLSICLSNSINYIE